MPPGIMRLVEAARTEDVNNMPMLLEAWSARSERFDGETSALYGAWKGDTLVGVGGMTPEKELDHPAIRMRKFYVLADFRKQGVATKLAETVMQAGLAHASSLTVNAAASPMAAPFWEAMDFMPAPLTRITHIYAA